MSWFHPTSVRRTARLGLAPWRCPHIRLHSTYSLHSYYSVHTGIQSIQHHSVPWQKKTFTGNWLMPNDESRLRNIGQFSIAEPPYHDVVSWCDTMMWYHWVVPLLLDKPIQDLAVAVIWLPKDVSNPEFASSIGLIPWNPSYYRGKLCTYMDTTWVLDQWD